MNIAVAIRGLATLAWVGTLVIIALAVFQSSRGKKMKSVTGLIIGSVVLALVLTTLGSGMVFIQPEERGVVISAVAPGGYRTEALQPGLRWVIPFAESVVTYPISKQTYTMTISSEEGQVAGDDSVTARTSDGQQVFIDASVIFAVDPSKVIDVHITWQNRYTDDLVRPLARGVIRDQASQFGVEEIYSQKRTELMQSITDDLQGRFEDNGLILIDFVLRNITFSSEYAASVEQKQIAEQRAQEARFTVEQRRQEAEQARQVAQGEADAAVIAAEGRAQSRLIEADAEATALKLIADALSNNPDLLTFEYIQKLSPGIEVMLVPNDSPYLLPLPSMGDTTTTPAVTVPEAE